MRVFPDMRDFVSDVERRGVSRGELDSGAWSDAHILDTGRDTFTQQHFADEVDINTIVHRFGITGQMPFGVSGGVYGDFSDVSDYKSAAAMIRGADERFMKLPPEVRERFNNSPAELIDFAQNVGEEEFMTSLGFRPANVESIEPVRDVEEKP